MIEKIIQDYLAAVLEESVVLLETGGITEVVLEKIGSSQENHITTSMLSAKSYGASLYDAACLNEKVKKAVFESVVLDEVSGCFLNSDYNNTDTATKRYCYRAVFNITHY